MEIEFIPDDTPDDGKEANEAVRPIIDIGQKTQQDIEQKGRPKLPLNRRFAVPQKIAHFQGLFDLLEENFDPPSRLVKFADTARGPFHVVGDESHLDFPSINFDEHDDKAEAPWILFFAPESLQGDLIIPENFSRRLSQSPLAHMKSHVAPGTGHPENTPLRQLMEMTKIDVCLVKEGNFAFCKARAEFPGPAVVVMTGLLDDHKGGKKALQIKPDMAFGRRFAPPVFGPTHAIGHQGNGGGINRVDGSLEATGQSFVSHPEALGLFLEMIENLPEQLLHHLRITSSIGMRERIAGRNIGAANPGKPRLVMAQSVAHVIETDRVGQLSVE